ncbi:hypothetical protein XELAEV_18000264mg [Xenopus laevis]|uniref:Uncharacterized protein n=1 Tax=Xenopus laevis TaxID=8355 RepID=A0A974GYL2_XENLA|nr:hypothetical protein XELAEV_18000264mg [Xenopus laevis]
MGVCIRLSLQIMYISIPLLPEEVLVRLSLSVIAPLINIANMEQSARCDYSMRRDKRVYSSRMIEERAL